VHTKLSYSLKTDTGLLRTMPRGAKRDGVEIVLLMDLQVKSTVRNSTEEGLG